MPDTKAEATDTRLWCLHHIGPDEVHPAPDFDTAQRWANYANEHLAKGHEDISRFVVATWPWSSDSHADGLAKSIEDWTVPADALRPTASQPAPEVVGALFEAVGAIADMVDGATANHPARLVLSRVRAVLAALSAPLAQDAATVTPGNPSSADFNLAKEIMGHDVNWRPSRRERVALRETARRVRDYRLALSPVQIMPDVAAGERAKAMSAAAAKLDAWATRALPVTDDATDYLNDDGWDDLSEIVSDFRAATAIEKGEHDG